MLFVFALLGIVTGVLSWLGEPYSLPDPPPFSILYDLFPRLYELHPSSHPVVHFLPGIIFGCLITACIYQFVRERRFPLSLFVPFAFTVVAWILASYSATIVFMVVMGVWAMSDSLLYALGGIVGGFVGGFVTVLGVSIANPRFRRPEPWMTTISIATVLGMLLEAWYLFGVIGQLALFTIWQAAVIAFVYRGMALGGEGPGL
jgi:hypothetical protein